MIGEKEIGGGGDQQKERSPMDSRAKLESFLFIRVQLFVVHDLFHAYRKKGRSENR
jgi:hypothetical protein